MWLPIPYNAIHLYIASIQFNTMQNKNRIQYYTIKCNTLKYCAIKCNTLKYNTIQYNTIQYNTIQYNTIQYNTIQYNTIQYNTIQYNTIIYNTIQYNTQHKYNATQCITIRKDSALSFLKIFFLSVKNQFIVQESLSIQPFLNISQLSCILLTTSSSLHESMKTL